MASKSSVKVYLNGKLVTIAGYESEEYMQRVANYLNRRSDEIEQTAAYRRMSADQRSVLLALNLADDYFKARLRAEALEQNLENHERDAYDVKQDFVSAKMEMDELSAENKQMKETIESLNAEIEKLRKRSRF